MSQSQPEADFRPGVGVKRPRTEPETTTPDPSINVEPDVKKQKIDNETPEANQEQLKIVEIDPEGDLTIIFRSKNLGYKFDSNALKRTSPILYQECLTVRPADDATWTFDGVSTHLANATGIILNIIHGNIDQVPDYMRSDLLHNVVVFAKKYGMKDRLSRSMKQWFLKMQLAGISNKKTRGKLHGLWISNELGLDTDCKDLQSWAVFNLSPDGEGGVGDPDEILGGRPVHMGRFTLADTDIIERVIRLRSEAVDMVIKNLKEVQLAMAPLEDYGTDGRIRTGSSGHACSRCLDLWFAQLGKSLLRPQLLGWQWQGFPSLSQVTEAKEYKKTLEELCAFVWQIQVKMADSRACSRKGQAACLPPHISVRVAAQDLISRGLADPIGSA